MVIFAMPVISSEARNTLQTEGYQVTGLRELTAEECGVIRGARCRDRTWPVHVSRFRRLPCLLLSARNGIQQHHHLVAHGSRAAVIVVYDQGKGCWMAVL